MQRRDGLLILPGFPDPIAQWPRTPLAKLRWHGHDVCYRPATSDPLAIYQVLLRRGEKAECSLPAALQPGVILDIGSNIGSSILFLREKFPAAKIYGFEPHPDTFLILQQNVGSLPGVEPAL